MTPAFTGFVSLKKAISVFVISLFLASCGGGGGGGSSGTSAGRSAATGIRMINAALDFPALIIKTVDGQIVSSANFAEVAFHGAVSAGPTTIAVSSASSPSAVLWNSGVELIKNQRKSVLAFGGYKERDIRFSLIEDGGSSVSDGFAAVRVINAVVDSSAVLAAVPGVFASKATSLGAASQYEAVPSGTYEFIVSSGEALIGRVSGTVQSGASYSVISHGAQGYFVTTNLLED